MYILVQHELKLFYDNNQFDKISTVNHSSIIYISLYIYIYI